jgi:F-type H+-transporting ATPase subunit alpha
LDDVPVAEVQSWEKKFLTFMRDQKPEIRDTLIDTQELGDDLSEQITAAISEFKTQYKSGDDLPTAAPAEKPEPALV